MVPPASGGRNDFRVAPRLAVVASFVLVVVAASVGVGLFALLGGIHVRRGVQRARERTETVEATVVTSETESLGRGRYRPVVAYEYVVDGRTYTGTRCTRRACDSSPT